MLRCFVGVRPPEGTGWDLNRLARGGWKVIRRVVSSTARDLHHHDVSGNAQQDRARDTDERARAPGKA